MNNSRPTRLAVVLGILLGSTLLSSLGCQSMGKMNLLAGKEIPVLTRDEGVDYPPPSAAETPSQTASTSSPLDAQVEMPSGTTNLANSSPAASPIAPADYPATNYGTFPQQPESLTATPGTPPSSGIVAQTTAQAGFSTNNVAPAGTTYPTANAAPHGSVQEGMYATKAAPTTFAPQDSDSFMATNSGPAVGPEASQFPVEQASFSQPAPNSFGGSDRDSEFGNSPSSEFAASPAASPFPSQPAPAAAPALVSEPPAFVPLNNSVAPAASPIPSYVESTPAQAQVATTTFEANSSSHYQGFADSQATNQPWRPGSTSTVTR